MLRQNLLGDNVDMNGVISGSFVSKVDICGDDICSVLAGAWN